MLPGLMAVLRFGEQAVNKDTPNPKADQEHPDPKAPADKRTAQSERPKSSGSSNGKGSSYTCRFK